MKKTLVIVFLICLNSNISHSQLLTNPSVSVEDFEVALSNPKHLRKILVKHNFEYTPGIKGKLNPFPIKNPLVPDLEVVKSEYWGTNSKDEKGSGNILRVGIYDWELGHSPQPEVFRTITVFLNEDSIFSDKVNMFFERIKKRYPERSKRYFQNSEFYRESEEPSYVFTNDNSGIEVRTEKSRVEPDGIYGGYFVSFDLLK